MVGLSGAEGKELRDILATWGEQAAPWVAALREEYSAIAAWQRSSYHREMAERYDRLLAVLVG